jgi:hypothetical protein
VSVLKHILYLLVFIIALASCKSSGDPLFTSSSKKGPNIQVDNGQGNGKSKSKNYIHSTSKKKIKGKRGSPFSSSKSRYGKIINVKSNKQGKKGEATGGRKSGKGRKKN